MTDTLASWNDGEARRAILSFVERATSPGDGYIETADRIAVFDNDGTMWIEQPLPVQLDFIFRALARAAQDDTTLADQDPYRAVLTKDLAFFTAVSQQQPEAIRALEEALARTWLGQTPAEFEAQVATYLNDVTSERFGVPYPQLVYRPMLELFALLEAHDFRVFVCSGGGRDFMRVIAESAWGIPRERVIGTAPSYTYEDGVIRRGGTLLGGLALGPGKPEHIFAYAGRMPAFAGGNADVDIEMLESATFALLVVHDDADREFAYTSAAEKSVAAAQKNGWTLVSVKDDWNTVF
ncbi:MAG: haloacid dehalogenase-like hydrolase [Humibacillus sp.]|nr:haloacid dehalogenase-like hydrolase [Humibacillus sp.]MDN5775912.1 haloacid dehalogenase-like hydrolase [Humibacillus sp.]